MYIYICIYICISLCVGVARSKYRKGRVSHGGSQQPKDHLSRNYVESPITWDNWPLKCSNGTLWYTNITMRNQNL